MDIRPPKLIIKLFVSKLNMFLADGRGLPPLMGQREVSGAGQPSGVC